MYQYIICFVIVVFAMCVIANIAFKWEMKRYKKQLERRGKSEKSDTVVVGGSNRK